ncbi:MAG: hypothetical protein QG657_5903 [Acidobacteriota bacterium]|nr:hypothetical protein [Acidobacteriota bacterium]
MAKKNKKNPLTGLEIAIIGMSGRFPGASNIDEFWKNLKNGKETISFFSDRELEESGVDPLLIKRPNYVKAKGIIDDIEYFDAGFFDYTPREARIMDPQIRLMHECAWEALENAGYDPHMYKGLIGIYAGASFNANWLSYFVSENDSTSRMTAGSLCNKDALCSLISYKLNLKGPSLTLYSACSTSLVAIHHACRSLLTGECYMALAGGAAISLPKKSGYLYEPNMIFSPDGHCRVFDAGARGTVFGDGAAAVLLKRLEDAIDDGDYIYAMVKASVVNNDGFRKAGYAAPSVEGQEEVARAALFMAEVAPESISYIETHGAGSRVGDSVEMEALGRVFNTGKKKYCAVGSVKTNVGHLDVAAGMAAFIKTAMALNHRLIPPTLHFKTPNPEIDFENSAFYVNTTPRLWENGPSPLRAGISGSGIGGSNVFLVLEEAPISVSSVMSRSAHLLVLSARSDFALDRATFNLYNYLKRNPGLNLADAAYTLQVGRHAFVKRRALVCRDNRDAVDILERRDNSSLFNSDHIDRSLIFMFPGQGTEYDHMAWELYRDEPVFKKYVDQCVEIIKSVSGYNLIDVLYPRSSDTSSLDQFHAAPLALFTVEYALARLWMDWGCRPRGMIGYGIGEYVAATISGVFTLEEALRSLWACCLLMQKIPEGSMVAVVLGENALRPFLGRNLWLAAINKPTLCVVSGTTTAVRHLAKELEVKRIPCIPLKSRWAFHSGMLDDILEPFARVLEQVPLKSPQVPFLSCVTGEWITRKEAVDPSYWVKQMRQPIHFSRGLQELLKEPNRILLEVGPGDSLVRLAKEHVQYEEHRNPGRILSSLRRGDEVESDQAFLLKVLGQLWVSGVMPTWESFYRRENRHRIPLPTYPFERDRYWIGEEKTQRKELTLQEITGESSESYHPRPVLSAKYAPPTGKIEKFIAAVWEEVIGIHPIGIYDNFIELGGNSLSATIVTSRIHRELDVNVSIKEMLDHPTIHQLARYVDGSGKELHTVIDPVEKRWNYLLSSAQKRLYFLWQMDKQSTAYNMPVVRVVEGEINREKCEAAFKKLIQRHESIRTSFHIIGDFPVQVVNNAVSFEIQYCDEENGVQFTEHIKHGARGVAYIKDFVQPFDLAQAPLLRVRLVKLAQQRHLLLFDMHHIISDGASMNIFIKDYLAFYEGRELALLHIQYKDFAYWQLRQRGSADLEKQEAYWKTEFEGDIPVLNLPEDYARNHYTIGNVEGSHINFEIDRQEIQAINKLAVAEGATLFIVVFSILNVLLTKLSGQEDIVVGSPIAGRRHSDIQQVIGIFINTLALRSFPAAGKTFIDFLGESRERVLQAFENQDYQFEDLVEKAGVTHDRSRNPFFDVMFVLQNTGVPEVEIPGLKLKPFHFKSWTSKFDITWSAVEADGLLNFRVLYRTGLFKEESIRRFIKYFKKIVTVVIRRPELKISEVEIITEEEKKQVLLQFNRSDADYPREKLLHQLFEEQVNRTPDHIAVVGSTVETGSAVETLCAASLQITYRRLNEQSDPLAMILLEKGVLPDNIVAIKIERSIEMITGILGILKSGGAYLPIDPDFPQERIDYMLRDSNARILLEMEERQKKTIVNCKLLIGRPRRELHHSSFIVHRSNYLSYVIYTSGTTGKPKGVLVEHRSAVNVVSWFGRKYLLRSGIHILQMSDYSFDASVNQIFGALLYGAALHVIDKQLISDINLLRDYINSRRVHVINFVPMFLTQLLCHRPKLDSLHVVISGAEALNDITKERILDKGYELFNQYGPTETTIDALSCRCSRRKVKLGAPIANTRCYVLDNNTNLAPVGVAGELYIAGEGVSRGYLNNPLLTAQKFVHLPFLEGERLYRSGDLVRWLAGGEIEFLGRIDEQVKIKGFRIELGEIRSQLLTSDSIKEAVVVEGKTLSAGPYGEESGENYLCAYYVSDKAVNPVELKNHLSQRLPAYMLPAYFVQVDKIPLTTVGKLDRKALPEPEERFDVHYIPPEGEIEEKLVEIWSDILGKKKEVIGRGSNFFDLGGHSLKATLLVSRIHKIFAVKLPLQQIFTTPVVKELARSIQAASEEEFRAVEPAEKKSYYILSSAQKRLYVLHKMDETSTAYNMLAVTVLEGILDLEKLEGVFIKLIQRHESLRTSFQLVEGTPVQKIHEEVDFKISYRDSTSVSNLDPVDSFLDVEKMIRHFVRPFDLSQAPLLRVELIKKEETRYMLMVDMHHIISDGVSVERFVIDFMALYGERELPALKLQYKDYAQWQEVMRPQQAENLKREEEYWKKQFIGEIPLLHLPFDYPRPRIFSFAGGQKHFRISREQTQALQKLALGEGATIYMVLSAVCFIFLSRLSGQEDIVLGTPTAGRRHADLQNIIGMFVNTLAIRCYPRGGMTVKDFIKEVRQRALEAFENQDYHFEDLVDQLSITRDVGRNPLFDVMFSLQNLQIPEIELPQLKMIPYPFERGASLFDLSIVAKEKEGQIQFIFEYNSRLFKQETVQRFPGYFKQLLAALPYHMEKKIKQLDLLPPEEKEQVLFLFNDTHFPYPRSMCIHGVLEQQTEEIPHHIVLIGRPERAGRRLIHISYKELNERANQVADMLLVRGVEEGAIVGIAAERSVETVIAIFGILKAGAAYLPIDPGWPTDRIDFILRDSGAKILIRFPEHQGKIIVNCQLLIVNCELLIGCPRRGLHHSHRLAYIIYTSGSTGRPKGVIVEHQSVVNRLSWIQQQYRLGKQDVVLQKTPFIFDVSVCELFRCLPAGGKVLLLPEGGEKEPDVMIETIEKHRATTIDFTPPVLNVFLDYISGLGIAGKVASLQWVFVGVETIGSELVKKFNEVLYTANGSQLINAYGPTETTVDVTAFNCSLEAFQGPVPIGNPMGNTRVYILDKYGNVQPIGVVGELYIAGDSVSRGYLNNPELTAEKFNRSYRTNKTYILYKTGDLARWLASGNIEFLGRIDRQVKIRGMRIELAEIENRLVKHNHVKDAVVLAKKDKKGAGYLCAFIVPGDADKITSDKTYLYTNELKEYLSGFLPDYMVPSRFVLMEDVPLTPTGKIDRDALPDPPSFENLERWAVAPGSEEEKILLEVWEEVLGFQKPGLHDNFFELGGDSIKAIQVAARLRTRGFILKLVDLFLNPRIRELAAHIHQANELPQGNPRDTRTPAPLHDHIYYDQNLNIEELDTIKRKIESMDWRGELS